MGHHSELKQITNPSDAADLPWSLLRIEDCQDDSWPPTSLPKLVAQTPEDALQQMLQISERWGRN